jgi:uncharacterized protein YbgA (DUF1722 family)
VKEHRRVDLRLILSAVVGAATVLLMCGIAKSESAVAHSPPKSTAQQPGYFVEFRVALIGTYSHSYVAYGRTGQAINYADLHPMGGYAFMALGHMLPVPANMEWNAEVLSLPVAAKYRRALSAQQYQKLVDAVRQARANKQPFWNAITNNCNHFIGQLALAIGLEVPSEFQVSYTFVPALRELNEKKARNSKN